MDGFALMDLSDFNAPDNGYLRPVSIIVRADPASLEAEAEVEAEAEAEDQ